MKDPIVLEEETFRPIRELFSKWRELTFQLLEFYFTHQTYQRSLLEKLCGMNAVAVRGCEILDKIYETLQENKITVQPEQIILLSSAAQQNVLEQRNLEKLGVSFLFN